MNILTLYLRVLFISSINYLYKRRVVYKQIILMSHAKLITFCKHKEVTHKGFLGVSNV